MPIDIIVKNPISLYGEMLAYETLWARTGVYLKDITEMFKGKNVLPSVLLQQKKSENLFDYLELEKHVMEYINRISGFSFSIYGTFQYPEKLRISKNPIELFYYRGDIGLLESNCVSIVGDSKCSQNGLKIAQKLSRELVHSGYTIMSGLETGVETIAMTTAIKEKGNTVGVIGTPLNRYYPEENKELQETVALDYMLISHVPFYRYNHEPLNSRKRYFVQKNEIIAALSEGVVIVEASDTNGSLSQADACFNQGKKAFILNSALNNPKITWLQKFLDKGGIVVNKVEDILYQINN